MTLPGRTSTGNDYRYGYQGSEKDDEIKGEGNDYMTHYRHLDPRVGRWMSIDPKFTAFETSYSSMSNNPILYNDKLGDTIRGNNNQSANRIVQGIKESLPKGLHKLFKLEKDGKTLSKINEKDFKSSITGLTNDEQMLAYSYYSAINSTDLHTVEVLNTNESTSNYIKNLNGGVYQSGLDVDKKTGGGFNFKTSNNSTYSVLIANSKAIVKDYVLSYNNSYFTKSSSLGELFAHEVIGHGVGSLKNSTTAHYNDAIQMTNLYLRVKGINYLYRDGSSHGKNSGDKAKLSKFNAQSVPFYINLPSNFKINNKKDIEKEEIRTIEIDKLRVVK